MAELLKYMYNPVFFERILPLMNESLPCFNEREFVYRVFDQQWPDLELKQRVKKIATALKSALPDDFSKAALLVTGLSQRFRQEKICVQGFELIFIPEFVGLFGTRHIDEALNALHEITRLASGEFAIRTFLNLDPEKTMARLEVWASDPDANVRRLASEGCRPRLPWGAGVPWLRKNPTRILPVLDMLKTDRSPYVRRSVANNLNDIAKDHPELVRQTVRRWKGENPLTDEIIRHGCRTLFKKGDAESLLLHGIDPKMKMDLIDFRLYDSHVPIGGALQFDLRLRSREKKPTRFRLDYAIDYCRASGRTSTRIFRLNEKSVEPDTEILLTRKQSFKNLTTRTHAQGKHTIHIIVNGIRRISRDFRVT